jgi:DNA-binding IscR family transcriptional regulator
VTYARSLAFHLAIFFAANPDECLTSNDIRQKWGCSRNSLSKGLEISRKYGYLKVEVIDGHVSGPGGGYMWSAGPTLLKLIGK